MKFRSFCSTCMVLFKHQNWLPTFLSQENLRSAGAGQSLSAMQRCVWEGRALGQLPLLHHWTQLASLTHLAPQGIQLTRQA